MASYKDYKRIKAKFPEYVMIVNTGKMFEMYAEDAQKAHDVLGITISERRIDGEDVLIAAFESSAFDMHLQRFVRSGYKCGLLEDMKPEQKRARKPLRVS